MERLDRAGLRVNPTSGSPDVRPSQAVARGLLKFRGFAGPFHRPPPAGTGATAFQPAATRPCQLAIPSATPALSSLPA